MNYYFVDFENLTDLHTYNWTLVVQLSWVGGRFQYRRTSLKVWNTGTSGSSLKFPSIFLWYSKLFVIVSPLQKRSRHPYVVGFTGFFVLQSYGLSWNRLKCICKIENVVLFYVLCIWKSYCSMLCYAALLSPKLEGICFPNRKISVMHWLCIFLNWG